MFSLYIRGAPLPRLDRKPLDTALFSICKFDKNLLKNLNVSKKREISNKTAENGSLTKGVKKMPRGDKCQRERKLANVEKRKRRIAKMNFFA